MMWLCALLAGAGVGLLVWYWLEPELPRRRPKRRRWKKKWEQYVAPTGTKMTWWQFALLSTVPALLTGMAVQLFTRVWALALLCTLSLATIPALYLHHYTAKKAKERRLAWPPLVDNLLSGVRSGMSLGETLLGLEGKIPTSLEEPFAVFAHHYRTQGNLDRSLVRLKDTLADPTADRIIEALRLASQVGGVQLVALFEELAALLRAEERARSELEARQSWTVVAARLACAAPWLVLALLLTNAQTARLYATATGSTLLLGGAAISLSAYLLMQRLGRLPATPRTLG